MKISRHEDADGERHATRRPAASAVRPTPTEAMDLARLLIASVQDYAIFILDPRGNIRTWNPGAERMKGYTAEEVIGRHFSIFYPQKELDRGHPAYELAVAEREGRYEEEGWRLRRGGEPFWASVTITALRDTAGTLIGFAKLTRDLTERKRADEALRQSEERFRLLVQSVRDYGIFMLDPSGRIVSWNEGAERINGYSEAEILGRHFSIFYPEEDLAWDKPEMELRTADREGRFEDEGWRLKKGGERFWANVVITPLRHGTDEPIGYAKVTRDLTERRAAEEKALDDARRIAKIEAANRAKSEFLAAMSHELRTPLNAIGGYVDLLTYGVHGALNDEQKAALERVRTSQRHLLTLINDLLNFSKIEAGRVTYNLTRVPLAEVARDVAPMTQPQAQAKAITIEWEPGDEDVAARADPARVEQILLNLVTNAVKYTDSGGRVSVRYFRNGNRALFEVTDTGVGIPAEYTDVIFEPFTQVGRSLRTPQEGTGLGLAISRDLARAMNGDLSVHSTEGEGSTFTLALPLAP